LCSTTLIHGGHATSRGARISTGCELREERLYPTVESHTHTHTTKVIVDFQDTLSGPGKPI
jgi:hypothetical protein